MHKGNRQGSWRRLMHVGIALVFYVAPASAALPILTFTPLTPTTLTVSVDGDALVRYQVTNQSALQHTFDVTPIVGVDVVAGVGTCSNPFTLAASQSCTLVLHLDGSQMSGNINGGPIACDSSNPLQCYQPAPADQLRVTLIDDRIFADDFDADPSSPLLRVARH